MLCPCYILWLYIFLSGYGYLLVHAANSILFIVYSNTYFVHMSFPCERLKCALDLGLYFYLTRENVSKCYCHLCAHGWAVYLEVASFFSSDLERVALAIVPVMVLGWEVCYRRLFRMLCVLFGFPLLWYVRIDSRYVHWNRFWYSVS